VARQMHHKTVQHYWVDIVKQQVTEGECPPRRDTFIQPMEVALNQITFLTQAQALLGKVIGEHTMQQNAEVKSIINEDRQVAPKQMPLNAWGGVLPLNARLADRQVAPKRMPLNTQHGGAFC